MNVQQFDEVIAKLQTTHHKVCTMELNMKQSPLKVGGTVETPFKSAVLTVAYNHLRNARMFLGDVLLEFGKFQAYQSASKPLNPEVGKPKHLVLHPDVVVNWKHHAFAAYKAKMNGVVPENVTENTINTVLTIEEFEMTCISFYKTFLGDAKTHSGVFYDFGLFVLNVMEAFDKHLEEIEVTKLADIIPESEMTTERKFTEDEETRMIEARTKSIKRKVIMELYLNNFLTELSLCNKHLGLRIGEILE